MYVKTAIQTLRTTRLNSASDVVAWMASPLPIHEIDVGRSSKEEATVFVLHFRSLIKIQ
jgi:hypothetical protein